MSLDVSIIEGIKEMSRRQMLPAPLFCTVDSVDLTEMTCYCIPKTGQADISDVRLIALNKPGFVITPKVNSDVIVAFIDNSTAYVALFSEIENMSLNGENFGGIPKVDPIKDFVDDLLSAIGAGFTAVGVGGAASGPAGKTAFDTLANVAKAALNLNIENTTSKHGDGT